MKILSESVNETRQNDERRLDEQKKSERFSQLLKSKSEKDQEKQSNSKTDSADAQQKNSPVALDSQPVNALDANILSSRLLSSSVSADAKNITQAGTATPPEVQKLVTEMGHQIDIFKQGGKAEAINISFDSKTLEGLQVQIRQQDGELAIRFVTQSDNVSNLLGRHTAELREALTSKGVRIRNITISDAHDSSAMRRNGRASG